jgi:membrane fusion protein (multidrug efflux system)
MEKTIQSTKIVSGLILAGLVLGSVLLKGYTSKGTTPEKPAPAPKSQGIPVDGQIIKSESLGEDLTVSGTLMAFQEVSIMSELNRKIVAVYAKEGRHVGEGTVLFKLDDADLLAELDQLKQQEKLVTLNERRLKELTDNEAAVQQDYDQAFTNLKVIQSRIDQLKVTIGKTNIRAPFSGNLGIVNVYPGTYVSPGTALALLTDNSQLKIDFAVPEKHAGTLKNGDLVSYQVESDGKLHQAKIVAHESRLDPNTRTLLMRAVGRNVGHELLPGQSARLNIRLNTTGNALMIPNQALIPSSKGYSVYVVNGGKAGFKNVEIGQRNAATVNVTSGLASGDTIITSNMLRLSPNAQIQLVTVK